MNHKQAVLLQKIIRINEYKNCLQVGFGNGKSSCYIAQILKNNDNDGYLTSIDLAKYENSNPNIRKILEELNLEDYVSYYFEKKSINTRLMKLIEDNDNAIFDFCYLDGSKDWHDKVFSFFLIDKLLKPNGLIIFNNYDWSYSSNTSSNNSELLKITDNPNEIPNIRDVYESLVKTHSNYKDFEIIGNWAFAYKKDSMHKSSINETIINTDFNNQIDVLNNKIQFLSDKLNSLQNELLLENNKKEESDGLSSSEINLMINNLEKKINTYEKSEINTQDTLKSHQFLLNSLMIDNKFESRGLLKAMQDLNVELLVLIDNICKKYHLKWWLDYGTLLGAKRHEDFIPWDDDIDISMMRKDYHKLVDVLPKEIEELGLSDEITINFRGRNKTKKKVNSFLQILLRERITRGERNFAVVDVFPYDYVVDIDQSKFGSIYNKCINNFYDYLANGSDIKSLYMGLNKNDVLKSYFDDLNLSYDDGKYIIPGIEGSCGYKNNLYDVKLYDSKQVFPLVESKFGDKTFYSPKNSYMFLKNYYNDYQRLPNIIRSHGRRKAFIYEPSIIYKHKKHIKILREVNKKLESQLK